MKILNCPFCGEKPWFEGDASEWKDESRYVELSLTCCSTMTETIGWMRARDMSISERTKELTQRLTERWNKRFDNEDSSSV